MCQDHALQFVPIDALHVGMAFQVLKNKTPQSNQSWSIGKHRMGALKPKIRILAAEVLKKSEFVVPPSTGSTKKNERHRA